MTEKEALEIINQNLYQGNIILALDIARKTISELQQYRSIGTVEECRETVEKQRAEKPLNIIKTSLSPLRDVDCFYGNCPCCGEDLRNFSMVERFCPNCGQKLDWSDRDD